MAVQRISSRTPLPHRAVKYLEKRDGAYLATRKYPPQDLVSPHLKLNQEVVDAICNNTVSEAEAQSDCGIDVVALEIAVGQSATHFRGNEAGVEIPLRCKLPIDNPGDPVERTRALRVLAARAGQRPCGAGAIVGILGVTCRNWTSSTQGAAMVGHSDRRGLRDDAASKSWNSSHPSRGPDGGCSQNDLRSTGGNGLFYCFADGEHWARHGRWREVRLRTLATPEPIKDWSLTSLKEKLIKIGAKVVSHGRYIAFQMAEVAIPRQMFQEILRLIAELRPQPPPTPA
jgi:Transposase DDE domain group 1